MVCPNLRGCIRCPLINSQTRNDPLALTSPSAGSGWGVGEVITHEDAKAINHDAIEEKLIWLFHLKENFLRRMPVLLKVVLSIPGKVALERYVYIDIPISISLDSYDMIYLNISHQVLYNTDDIIFGI